MNHIAEIINNIETTKLLIIGIFIPSVIFIFYLFSIYIRGLPNDKRKEFLKKFFGNISLSEAILQLITSFIVLNKERDSSKDNDIKKDIKYHGQGDSVDEYMDNCLREEYLSSKITRMVFINLFVMFTFSVIFGFIWLDRLSYETRITIGCIYFGFSCFVLFIIKSCYARTAVILSILEDRSKKKDIHNYFVKYKKTESLNEYDVDFLRLMNVSRSEREKKTSHPYEMIFKNIQGSTFSLGKGKIKIGNNNKRE